MLLAGWGYDVTVAYSGEEALDLLRMIAFDVLISDIEMPGMTGIELADAVKLYRVPVKRFVAISGSSAQLAAATAHFDLCVPKPVPPGVLEATLRGL
jgi:CheY-like chemotaxis protein